jgi:hypothetical protein
MRVVRNDAFIKKRTQLTQRGSLIGMGLLLGSLFLSTRNTPLSWVLLVAGFVTAMAAVRMGNRYVRPPRPDTVLDKVLKGLDNRYVLYHYLQPAEHLLLTPSGLVAIQMQEQRGQVAVHDGQWRQRSLWQRLRVLLGEAGLGRPDRRLERDIDAVREVVQTIRGDKEALPVEGVIVFYSGKVQLEVQDPRFPTLAPENLRMTIRSLAEAHPPLPSRAHKALAAALQGEEVAEEIEPAEEAAPPEKAASAGEKRRGKRSRSRKAKKGR